MITITTSHVAAVGLATALVTGMAVLPFTSAASILQKETDSRCVMACPGADHTSDIDSEPDPCHLSARVTWGISIVYEEDGSEMLDGTDCTDCMATASFVVSGDMNTKWRLVGTGVDLSGVHSTNGTKILRAACGTDGWNVPATDLTLVVETGDPPDSCKKWRTVSLTCNSYIR